MAILYIFVHRNLNFLLKVSFLLPFAAFLFFTYFVLPEISTHQGKDYLPRDRTIHLQSSSVRCTEFSSNCRQVDAQTVLILSFSTCRTFCSIKCSFWTRFCFLVYFAGLFSKSTHDCPVSFAFTRDQRFSESRLHPHLMFDIIPTLFRKKNVFNVFLGIIFLHKSRVPFSKFKTSHASSSHVFALSLNLVWSQMPSTNFLHLYIVLFLSHWARILRGFHSLYEKCLVQTVARVVEIKKKKASKKYAFTWMIVRTDLRDF